MARWGRRLAKIVAGLALLLLAGLWLGWTPDTDPAAMRAKYGGAPSQFVDLGGGLRVHLRDEGPRAAPVIVLLHGSNADLHTWDAWGAQLAGKYRVIRYDQIGHGLTGPNPRGTYATSDFADTLEALVQKLSLDTFVLAGNSMGGGIAVRYALDHPARLRGLVLIDAAGAPKTEASPGNIGFALARTPGMGWLMQRVTPRGVIARSLHQTVVNQAVVTPAVIDRYWELLRYPGNRAATAARFGQGYSRYTARQVVAIKVPTLILWGADDPLLPVDGGRWYQAAIPGSALIVYPATGHLPMEEVAARSASDLAAWLEKQPPR